MFPRLTEPAVIALLVTGDSHDPYGASIDIERDLTAFELVVVLLRRRAEELMNRKDQTLIENATY